MNIKKFSEIFNVKLHYLVRNAIALYLEYSLLNYDDSLEIIQLRQPLVDCALPEKVICTVLQDIKESEENGRNFLFS